MKLLNYTTEVPASKSIMEIETLLSEAGAKSIQKEYESGKVKSVFFALPTRQWDLLTFRLPANVDAVRKTLREMRLKPHGKNQADWPERVAWRLIKDWTAAQLSLIKVQDVPAEQVFLAYAFDFRSGRTVFEIFQERHFMLPSGEKDEE